MTKKPAASIQEIPADKEKIGGADVRLYSVEIPAAEMDAQMQSQINKTKPDIRLPGFRKGKASDQIIRQRFGERIAAEVIEKLASEIAQRIVQENNLRPALAPHATLQTQTENIVQGGSPLKMTIRIEPAPEITPPNLNKLALVKPTTAIDDKDVNAMIANLLKNHPLFPKEGTDKTASEGDLVIFDFDGTMDDKPFKDGSGKDAKIILGRGSALPGFEKIFTGRSAGFKDSIKARFPDDHPEENLKSREAVFNVRLKSVHPPMETQADENFAKRMGYSSLAKLREAAREEIAKSDAILARAALKRQILDHLEKQCRFAPPPTLVAREFSPLWQQFLAAREAQKSEQPAINETAAQQQLIRLAEARVRVGLVLAEIGAREKLEISAADIKQAIAERARQFPGREKDIAAFYEKDPRARAALHAPLFEEKVIDWIVGKAEISEKSMSRDEMMRYSQTGEIAR